MPTLAPPKPDSKKEFIKHQEDEVRAKLAALPVTYKDPKIITTVRNKIKARLDEAARRYGNNGNTVLVSKAYHHIFDDLKDEIYELAEGKLENKDHADHRPQTGKRKGKVVTQTPENTSIKNPKQSITREGLGKTDTSPPTGQAIKPQGQAAPLTNEQKSAQQAKISADIAKRQAVQTPREKGITRGGDVGHGKVSTPTRRMSSKQIPNRQPNKLYPAPKIPTQLTFQPIKPRPTKRSSLMGSKPPTLPRVNQITKPGTPSIPSKAANSPKTSTGNITPKVVIPAPGSSKAPAAKQFTKIFLPIKEGTPPKPVPPGQSPVVHSSTKIVIPSKLAPPKPSFPISQTLYTTHEEFEEVESAQIDRGLNTPDRRERRIPTGGTTTVTDTTTTDTRPQWSGGGGGSASPSDGGDDGGGSPPNGRNKNRRRGGLIHDAREVRGLIQSGKQALTAARIAISIPWPVWAVAGLVLLVIIVIVAMAGGGNPPPPPPPPPPTQCQDAGGPAAGEPSTEQLMTRYGHNPAEVEANLVDINFQGKTVKVHKLVQPVFDKVNTEINQANTGYAFRQVGTYAWREKNGGGSGLSTHSFGISIDINPDTNPYSESPAHDIPPVIADIFKRNGFGWGGDWQGAKDWMHFQYEALPAPGPGGAAVPGAPGCGGAANENYVPPAPADSCGGKYSSVISKNTLLPMNYGDPQCNFSKDKLRELLVKQENNNQEFVNFWFVVIIPGESGFDPNAWAIPSGTQALLDSSGAWGLYQKGASAPAGSPPPAPGKNGPLDRGDVNWEVQTSNAVKANREAGCTFWYYGTFRRSPEGAKGETRRC